MILKNCGEGLTRIGALVSFQACCKMLMEMRGKYGLSSQVAEDCR